jgi:glycosyltransferase involved in cell wall biosynthesis
VQKILLIGPLGNKLNPTKAGGTDVLFLDLIHQLDQNKIKYTVIDTDKSNYYNAFIALLTIWLKLIRLGKHCNHISLHGTVNSYIFVAPIAVFYSKLLKKTISLRKFAGNFNEVYESMPFFLRWIISGTLQKSDFNFFETHYLVTYFSKFNPNTFWFPNVRTKPNIIRNGDYKKRFIFIGDITREKGILELLEASNLLDDTYTIHLYGKINNDFLGFDFSPYKAEYKKALAHQDVLKTMCQYDVLILPSHREGYPGVIIEALSIGLPIIASNLDGIKEMIDEKCAVFIHPHNSEEISNALSSINTETYPSYSANALLCFEKFDSCEQTKKFIDIISSQKGH